MGKMNWTKARKFKATEEKYERGKVMDNGRVVASKPRDGLEKKADHALQQFGRGVKMRPYQPTAYDIARNPKLAPKKKSKEQP